MLMASSGALHPRCQGQDRADADGDASHAREVPEQTQGNIWRSDQRSLWQLPWTADAHTWPVQVTSPLFL